jgi:uncharacterized glyoxalase superfamily protein PhnB
MRVSIRLKTDCVQSSSAMQSAVVWPPRAEPVVTITKPFDGNPATVGNGVMVAMKMPSKEAVDAFYQKAIELGATDEGAPGQRGEGFYAGYFRDLDGNKLNAFVFA